VPVYIDRDDVGDAPLRVFYGLGSAANAKFLGSDRKTGLSVLQLDKTGVKPVNLAGKRPAEGSLVMVLATSGEGGQLLVWTGGVQENTIVVSCDGAIAGFTRMGQFLAGEHARPIVKQLIDHGIVRRAQLGVYIRQIEGPSGKPVVGIEDVEPGSVADKAGLKRGDIIVSLASQPVADVPSFAATIAQQDGMTDLQVIRNGETQTITVELHPK
jgi:S1-C subfamily serine protease